MGALSDPRLAWYALEWAIRLAALGLVPLRRGPQATASWLLLIFFLPVPGAVLFAAIGSPRFPAWRKRRWREMHPFFEGVAGRLAAAGGEADAVARFAGTLGRLPQADGNRIELIDDYDRVIDRLVDDAGRARERIDILAYIFADDAVGRRVADALTAAAARGVRVRVMFDPVGSHRWRRAVWRMFAGTGVEVREALPWRLWRRSRGDMRNHRKLFVIDGLVGYAGSQNIVAKDFRPGVVNRELVARVEGPVVAALAAVVAGDWAIEREGETPAPITVPAPAGDARLQLLPSGADYPLEGFETLLVWLLHRAERRVVLATPYFVPDEPVLAAMRAAAARGVAVDLIVSQVVDQRLVHLAQCSYFEALLDAGVRVREYRGFLLHAKNVGVDGTIGIVGSSNVDLRSFQLNEEASLLLRDPASVAHLDAVQRGYVEGSDPIAPDAWRRRPRARRLAENVARVMSPLL